jgi:FkbM family methyltransferase
MSDVMSLVGFNSNLGENMSLPFKAKYARKIRRILMRPDRFLRRVSGVIHVGANSGQERKRYHRKGLDVVWIEPIPEVFKRLEANILPFSRQKAVQALVTDRDDQTLEFHISNNDGASSSILPLKDHRDLWPEVVYTQSIKMQTTTLPTLLHKENIDSSKYQALVMDTQGSELHVLRGAESMLANFEYIKTEVADFESYEGCCQLSDLNDFMSQNGIKEFSKDVFAMGNHGEKYYDVIYRRAA